MAEVKSLHGKHEDRTKKLKEDLLASRTETKKWRQKYLEVSKQKAQQLTDIEAKLYILHSTLLKERKAVEKKMEENEELTREQRDKIDKLTSANKKLLNGLMLLRYDQPKAMTKLKHEREEKTVVKQPKIPSRKEEVADSEPSPRDRLHSMDNSVLVQNRARLLAQAIQRKRLVRMRTTSHLLDHEEVIGTGRRRGMRSMSLCLVEP